MNANNGKPRGPQARPDQGGADAMTPEEERDRQIEMALLELGPPIQTHFAVNSRSRKRSIDTIIKKLNLPTDEDWDGLCDISDRVDLMQYVLHCVENREQMQPPKPVYKKYVEAFRRLQDATRELIEANEYPLIAQDATDRMFEIANRRPRAVPKWFSEQIAVEQAHELLQILGHPIAISPTSDWHCVAAALLGKKNEAVDLLRQMKKVHKAFKTGGRALSDAVVRGTPRLIYGSGAYHSFGSNCVVEHRQTPAQFDEYLRWLPRTKPCRPRPKTVNARLSANA
jgi:hypothetical protein